jgi:hypothetical protein
LRTSSNRGWTLEPPRPAPPSQVRREAPDRSVAWNPAWHSLATRLQPKLTTPQSGEPAERQADHLAERVLHLHTSPQPPSVPEGQEQVVPPTLQKKTAAPVPQPPSLQTSAPVLPPGPSHRLASPVSAFFGPRFGHDFSEVRVHSDGPAARWAQSLNAQAYTAGNHIVFAAGQYAPNSGAGQKLLAHELAHVVQQRTAGPGLQRQPAAPAAPAPGSLADMQRFVSRPQDEPDNQLRAAMGLWSRYRPQVAVEKVQFRLLTETASYLGHSRLIGGRSYWDGTTPVIEVPQVVLDDVAAYVRQRGTVGAGVGLTAQPVGGIEDLETRSQLAPLARAHEAVRLLGHELHHLWREKTGHAGNPIHPVYEAEAQRRMAQVRQNWLDWIITANETARGQIGIPRGTRIQRWEDIPASTRQDIEKGATKTEYIEGLYQRSAYLVEEIYTKIEELSYLRQQQRDPTAGVHDPSLWAVSDLARQVYFLHNVLKSVADPGGPVTPELVRQTDAAILTYLRRRYPSSQGPQFDSYEVVFYLSALHGGLPPIYSNGRCISRVPGARLPT